MDSADMSFGFTGMTASVLRELRGERRAATSAGSDPGDRFVASGAGSPFFADHLRPLREASPATGPHSEPVRREEGPDTYLSREAPSIVRRTFEESAGAAETRGEESAESAQSLQREPQNR